MPCSPSSAATRRSANSGYKGAAADASFGANDEALANFGGNQLNKVHDIAVQLLRRVG